MAPDLHIQMLIHINKKFKSQVTGTRACVVPRLPADTTECLPFRHWCVGVSRCGGGGHGWCGVGICKGGGGRFWLWLMGLWASDILAVIRANSHILLKRYHCLARESPDVVIRSGRSVADGVQLSFRSFISTSGKSDFSSTVL